MADSLVLFYYWNLFGLWLALHWLLKHYFTAVFPLLLLEFWLVYDWFELAFKYWFSPVLCMVWLKSSFYFTTYHQHTGEIQLYYKAGFLIDLTCGSLNFGFFYLFSRNIKPIKLKSCRNLYHKGDNLGNIVSVMHDYS